MKEAFELIKERLEEESQYSCSHCMDRAISIVSEVEAEYINKSTEHINKSSDCSTNWIDVKDRLPNKEEYNNCNGQFIVTDGNRTYATYFDIYDTFKFGEPTMNGFRIDRCVIAWMPLPSPFKPEKGE